MSAYSERYSVKGSSGVSAGIFRKLIFKCFFFLENFFFGLKVMLKSRTNRGSVQKVFIICLFWKVMARNCLLDEICIVCVSLKRFLLAGAAAISSSFRRFFLSLFSLYKVSCIPLIEVVTVLVSFVMFFHGSYGLSKFISSSSNWMCVLSQTGIWEDIL